MKKIDSKKMHILFNKYKRYRTTKNLEKIYIEYKDLAYGIAFSFVKNKDIAEDIVQNVFYKLFNIKDENLPSCNESSWFYTVVKNECLNFIKRDKENISIDEIYNVKDPNNDISNITDIIYFNQIIKNLSATEKEIISLKIISNLSFREISKLLDMPIATVEWKYYKSLKIIRLMITNLVIFMISFTYGCCNIKTKEVSKEVDISKENVIENTTINTNTNIENELVDRIPEENTNTTTEETIIDSNNTYEIRYITSVGILSFTISLLCIISLIFNLIKNKKRLIRRK